MTKEQLTNVFRVLVRTLEGLNDAEYQELLSGKGKLVFQGTKKTAVIKNDKENNEYVNVIGRLRGISNRTEGLAILDQEVKLKRDLVGLAKQVPVYVAKSDTKERVREKIIEALVGTKLASEAIDRVKLK